jgi:predicted HAD superfamily Cof-like phosphohydrolase
MSLPPLRARTADQVYVAVGTASACGLNMGLLWDIVHESNMAKFGPGGYRRPDGKWMKPPGWEPPTKALAAEIDMRMQAPQY